MWRGMSADVEEYCRRCAMCQQHKASTTRVPITSKLIPARCLEEVSFDVVCPVPSAWTGAHYILCVQDRLPRYLIFAPMGDQMADTTAQIFLASWICQFGAPRVIVTNRGSNFMSVFSAICRFLGAKHAPTCAYRPQGNAQNERAHKDLHVY